MNLKQLREEAWDVARETAINDQDRMWSVREMNRYVNRIYKYIAKETRCIKDAVTTSVCTINVAPVDYTTYLPGTLDYLWANTLNDPNDPNSGGKYWLFQRNVAPFTYTLHPSILDIVEVKWTDRQWKLVKVSVNKWQSNPWWEQVVGMPTEFATDYSTGLLTINFRADFTDMLRLIVKRLPLVDLIDDSDSPEFRLNYHELMINGILWQMYSKQDSQAFDGIKAETYRQMFMKDIDEIKQQEAYLDERLRPNNSMDGFR